jgi:hypothetical protein
MLEDYYVHPSTIDRIRASWLAPQMDSYLEWLDAHGYSLLVVFPGWRVRFNSEQLDRRADRSTSS